MLLTAKVAIWFLAPEAALRSLERAPSRPRFVAGGLVLLAVGGWAVCCAARPQAG